ncbi:hypothetical protein ACFX2I_037054 [Malus domestica]|uniref:uncharacterized protein n=1 Tax=Malus domestica TaxID=3750 RepID=UPI00049922D5|nr:uncharacterized protein LOC103434411 [Malus domestica]
MAALNWLLNSACHVLLHPIKDSNMAGNPGNLDGGDHGATAMGMRKKVVSNCSSGFQMPLHYPRYTKVDYGKMEEWKIDLLLRQYGLGFEGNLYQKRDYAMGAFLWPDQC